jgi:hypothetical protein
MEERCWKTRVEMVRPVLSLRTGPGSDVFVGTEDDFTTDFEIISSWRTYIQYLGKLYSYYNVKTCDSVRV